MTDINVECQEADCHDTMTRKIMGLCEKHYKRKWRARNPQSLARARDYSRTRRELQKNSDPELYSEQVRIRNLWANYKMTTEEYENLLEVQEHRCAICGRHESEFEKKFAVDHDHACCTGRTSCGKCTRGLLCVNCNNGLGRFMDQAEILESALRYVRQHSAVVNES